MANVAGSAVPGNARLGSQWLTTHGLCFRSESSSEFVAVVDLGTGSPSGTNGFGGVDSSGSLAYVTPINIEFFLPSSPTTPAVTDFVSLRCDLNPFGSGQVTLQAFDLFGTLLASDTQIDDHPASLSVSHQGIHSVRVIQSSGTVAFDDLSFGTPLVAVPAPKLTLRPLGSARMELSWPANFSAHRLESATTLPADAWVPVALTPATNENVLTVQINSAERSRFFRLAAPGPNPAAGRLDPMIVFSKTDGGRPFGDLLGKDGAWWGTTSIGGEHDCGTLFKIEETGRFQSLKHFDNSEGQEPFGILCDGGDFIYGAAKFGGLYNGGTLFACRPDGTGFEVLHSFGQPQSEGSGPHNGPILVEGRLYGTTFHGGSNLWEGGVYAFDLSSRQFTWLASLGGALGYHPTGALLLHNGWLYGTTSDYERDAWGDYGTVFRLRPDGSGLQTVHRFGPGGHPYDRLVLGPDGWLYGTTHGAFSDPDEHGAVFRLDPESGAVETVIDFNALGARQGSKPNGGVTFSADGRLLFATTHGNIPRGGDRPGTLFAFDLALRRLHVLHVFDGGLAGDVPMRTPALVGNRLCGMTAWGGLAGEAFPNGKGLAYAYYLPDLTSLPGLQIPNQPTGTNASTPFELTCPAPSGGTLNMFVFPARPRTGSSRPPVAVLLHGGGWVSGNAALMSDLCRRLAWLGVAAVAPEFRRAGTNGVTVPDMVADCRAAIAYLWQQADSRGWDRDRILVLGESTGGHLAGLLATDDTNEVTRCASAVVLLNPVLEPARLDWAASQVGLAGPGGSWTNLSVAGRMRVGLAPVLVLHGDQDPVVPVTQSVEFAQALQGLGNRCDLVILEMTGHAFALEGYGTAATILRTETEIEKFLRSLGWLVQPK